MSQTLGNLIDQQSILMIRRACAHSVETRDIIDKMLGQGRDEINQFHYQVMTGIITDKDIVIKPKLKNYAHQDNKVPYQEKMGDTIQDLIEANIKLWDIEDDRRDTTKTDAQRLALADQVSVWNKKRNDAIDQIDQILWAQSLAAKISKDHSQWKPSNE